MFELIKKDTSSKARLGKLLTTHGVIETPIFMPVGTQATVKAVSPRELHELGAQIILGNTYHLMIRPGMKIMNQFGGIHGFSSWTGPVLTDSGGFQVFSLSKLRKIEKHGVRFQSHVDGTEFFLGPKEAMDIQWQLGGNIAMAFDECPPYPCDFDYAAKSLDVTLRWAKECKEYHDTLCVKEPGKPKRQMLFGIVQGSVYADLRRRSAEELVKMDFDGYAVGGVSVGETEVEMMKAVEESEPYLPEDKARYAMGLGTPPQIVEMVARGVDMFDCVLPTRVARNGTAFTRTGTLNLRNAIFKEDAGAIEEGCQCYACQNFSRAYIRHLVNVEEILGLRLVTLHNLHFYLQLMRDIRTQIAFGTFNQFREQFVSGYKKHKEV
ncbi:MAG: tRNA guanosine(34) transglycosylase Tgt [Verrucomicrobiota bacterium]|nr:tRNA guanosine(34) transglycosylase Tgt [Verrucomicrobiota bacterium]